MKRACLLSGLVMVLGLGLGMTPEAIAGPGSPAEAVASPTASRTTATDAARTAYPVLSPRTVLFLENHRIESTRNFIREYNKGRKISLYPNSPGRVDLKGRWVYTGADDAADGDRDIDSRYLMSVSTVMREMRGGKPFYHMWLRSGQHTGYRQSTDGYHWKVHSPDSVIVAKDVTDVSVDRDPRTGHYYMLGWDKKQAKATGQGYVELNSPDGINWERSKVFRGRLSVLFGDLIEANFDPVTGELLTYAKAKTSNGRVCRRSPLAFNGGRRFTLHVSNATNARAYSLTTTRSVFADCIDARSRVPIDGVTRPGHVYGMPFQRYGDQFLAFPWLFWVTRQADSPETSGWTDGPVDSQIAATPDPRRAYWTRATPTDYLGRKVRPVLIQRGPRGTWDDGMLYAKPNIMTINNRSMIYYTGWNDTHTPRTGRQAKIGAAVWRKDSFVAMKVRRNGFPATLQTKAFRLVNPARKHLRVNVVIPSGRVMRVGVLDATTGKELRGFQARYSRVIRGNHTSTVVTWLGKNLGKVGTRPIKLKFHMRAGKFYSMKVS